MATTSAVATSPNPQLPQPTPSAPRNRPEGGGLSRSGYSPLRACFASPAVAPPAEEPTVANSPARIPSWPASLDAEVLRQIEVLRPLRPALCQSELSFADLCSLGPHLIAPLDESLHPVRVTLLMLTLRGALGLKVSELSIQRGCLLHDVGKRAIPERVLHRTELSAEDRGLFKGHTLWGQKIAGTLTRDPVALSLVRSHHERWDGSGYPDGLRGEEIPAVVRLFSVVDSWDCMVHPRTYRPRPLSEEQAREELRANAGSQYEPEAVEAFLRWRESAGHRRP